MGLRVRGMRACVVYGVWCVMYGSHNFYFRFG